MVRFVPVMILALTAVGLLIGGVSPAWWITALAAVGLGVVVWFGTSGSFGGRSVYLAPYLPAVLIGLAAVGLLIAGRSPAWWIAGLVAIGYALLYYMSTH